MSDLSARNAPVRPALDSRVWFSILPHAAPAPAPLFSAKGRGLRSDPILHAQAAQRDTDATAYQARSDDIAA